MEFFHPLFSLWHSNRTNSLMDILKAILKDKLFYIVLATILVISSAMRANREVNNDLVEAYYSAVDTTVVEQSPAPRMGLRDSLVAFALTLQGKPYRYAGKGPDVFDCSGFTGYVYRQFNMKLPASSALQAKYGHSEVTDSVKKGDLLIFKSPTKGVNRVGHVGMVISNENGRINFIHSSTGRGVVIDSLSHHHYNARYLGARDILR